MRKPKDLDSYRMGIGRAIRVYTPYVSALEEENERLASLAIPKGYTNREGDILGRQHREKIKELKKESLKGGKE